METFPKNVNKFVTKPKLIFEIENKKRNWNKNVVSIEEEWE